MAIAKINAYASSSVWKPLPTNGTASANTTTRPSNNVSALTADLR